jgi:hypothetical protein
MQLEIDCIEWALQKIEVNKLPNDRLERVIKSMIKDLEKRKDSPLSHCSALYHLFMIIPFEIGTFNYIL